MDRLSYPMDKRTENKIKYKYIGIQFLFWATVSAVSFEVVFLREEGFKNATIGTIMAVVAFARIFAQPLWGIVSDRVGSIKKIFMLCLAVVLWSFFYSLIFREHYGYVLF